MSVHSTTAAGIGGWLIIPAIGLALAPFGCALMVFGTSVFLITEDLAGLWYTNPAIVFVSIFQLLGYLIIGIMAWKTSYAFFKRKFTAPKLLERLGIAEYVFEATGSISYAIISDAGAEGWMGVFLRTAVGAIALGVWIAYFEMSRRVQATFVN